MKIGKTVKMSVLSQHLDELNQFGDYEVREVLSRYKTHYTIDGKEYTSSQLLEMLGFKRAHFQMPVSKLSGGQKRRLQLMLTLLTGCNVMVLDEPGNDMDIDMLSQRERVLDGWPATLIMVTHDRHLMERVTDNQYAIIAGKVRHVPGGVDEYLHMLAHGAARPAASNFGNGAKSGSGTDGSESSGVFAGSNETGAASSGASKQKMSNSERQAARRKRSSIERKMETTRGKIEDAKQRLADADPTDYMELQDCEEQIASLKDQLSELEDEWLEVAELLEDE